MGDTSNNEVPFERLGPFEIVKPLATGGMAQIFLGRNLGSFDGPETVVIKAWHPPRATSPFERERSSNLLSRFIEEGRLGMRLKHPAIARSFGIMQDPTLDLYFLVQEYVYGATLTDLISFYAENDIRIPYNIILKLMIPVLEALHYAYFNALREDGRRLRVIHRDIKPDNIMLGFDGRVQVLDFGVAKTSSLTRENTVGTMVVGTRYYMAPEQAYEPEKVGHHTDLFSAGLILYELCCLRSPFEDARTISEFARALRNFDFEQHAGTIDATRYPGLREILTRALAVDVSRRYRSGADMANDLRAMLELTPKEPALLTFARHLKRDLEEANIVKTPPFSALGGEAHDAAEEENFEEEPTILEINPVSWPTSEEEDAPDLATSPGQDARAAFPPEAVKRLMGDQQTPHKPREARILAIAGGMNSAPISREHGKVERPSRAGPLLQPIRSLSAWEESPDVSPGQGSAAATPLTVAAATQTRARNAPRPPTLPPEFLPFAGTKETDPNTEQAQDTGANLGAQPLSEIRSLWFEQPLETPAVPSTPEASPSVSTPKRPDRPARAPETPSRPPVGRQAGGTLAPPHAETAPDIERKSVGVATVSTESAPVPRPLSTVRSPFRISWPSLVLGIAIGAAISSTILLIALR